MRVKGLRRPSRPLRPGDGVLLVRTSLAESYPEWDEVRGRLLEVGLCPVFASDPDPSYAPYADSDKNRLREFFNALTGRPERAILPYRGGSGSLRLLCEWEEPEGGLGEEIPAVCGFSDMTYLHAALACRLSLVTFWGPNARELRDRDTFSLWWAMLSGTVTKGDFLPLGEARTLRPGRASGPLLGGNLESLAHLCGTPFLPDLSGAILLLEDIDEPLYAVDRALRTLFLAGVLKKVSGVVVGPFTGWEPRSDDPASSVADLVLSLIPDVPVMEAGLPGHGFPMATWPLNLAVDLRCPQSTLAPSLQLLEAPFEQSPSRTP